MGSEDFGSMKDSALADMLKDPTQKAKYMEKRAAWCEERRLGKRAKRRGEGDFAQQAWEGDYVYD